MDHRDNEKKLGWQKRQLVLTLAAAAAMAVIMGTLAWLSYNRGLQTVTRMQMPILWLRDKNDSDIAAIDLGNLDISNEGKTYCLFGVYATADTSYNLQLAYTTNIPLNYKVYCAARGSTPGLPEQDGFSYGEMVIGQDGSGVKGIRGSAAYTHTPTYGGYSNVQGNAEPVYWQAANARAISRGATQYYLLEVSWGSGLSSNKESDMIYVTVATALESTAETTGGSQ